MLKWIKEWWQGKYVEPPQSSQYDTFIIMMGDYEKHWTSKFVHWLISLFTNSERRAVLLTIFGLISCIFLFLNYFNNKNSSQQPVKSTEKYEEITKASKIDDIKQTTQHKAQ
ncbi:hypothetical protein [Acinetobacter nosocomialis]|uniref:hypothetical protein n=1 Tax=Acinetobacter nosocomialis TaxID=106654 RepID=UPI00237E46F8|nr:hypothetical protein [Acinetobacter nosocomialis]MDE1703199.1 hypothetical protein [Acinetobacter nosocomialis]HDG7211708.1 hypothetical protein [Acinetobacter nosocomialis]